MQVALAWLLQRSPTILLIPGTSSVAHLRENAGSAGVELPAEAVAALNAVGTADRFAPWESASRVNPGCVHNVKDVPASALREDPG
jgi:diketogulonate reductase-like aldo/keto reductase